MGLAQGSATGCGAVASLRLAGHQRVGVPLADGARGATFISDSRQLSRSSVSPAEQVGEQIEGGFGWRPSAGNGGRCAGCIDRGEGGEVLLSTHLAAEPLQSAEIHLASMTIFNRTFRAATALSLLLVLSSTVCANVLFPPQAVDVHFEVRGTGLPEEERTRVLRTAEDFKSLTAAGRVCAVLFANADGYDGSTDAQMRLSSQRAQTVADLLKTVEIRSSVSGRGHTETEQRGQPPHWPLPIRASKARIFVIFSSC